MLKQSVVKGTDLGDASARSDSSSVGKFSDQFALLPQPDAHQILASVRPCTLTFSTLGVVLVEAP